MVLDEYPDKNIFILDTLSCAGALAEARGPGQPADWRRSEL